MSYFDLQGLPDTVLIIIGKLLSPIDLSNISEVNSRFSFLRNYLPHQIKFGGGDFYERGPHDGHFVPRDYFQSPIMFSKVKKITMSFDWCDQGYGNRKGMIWVEVIRKGKVIANSMEDEDSYEHVAPHREEHKTIEIENTDLIRGIQKGDILMFRKNVGGGGGHSLSVKNFICHLELNKY